MRCKTFWLQGVNLALGAALAVSGSSAVAATPAQTVADHLAAGEFGLAAQVAGAASDATEQVALLQQVAAAQQQAGLTDGVRGTLQRIPTTDSRARAQGSAAQQAALAGGGVMADFQSLINIIQQNTDAEWEEIDGVGGTATPYQNGVRVAPGRLLSRIATADKTDRLASLGQQVRQADINDDMAKAANLRLVSLKRLEQEVAQRLEAGQSVPESMARLAGLSKVEYVFFDAANKDVIIGGPAEAWKFGANGEPIGIDSGRPTLQLDDLVVVLRSFASGSPDFGCSINTRDEGVKALQDYAAKSQARGPIDSRSVRSWVKQLQTRLGHQDIEIWGVPNDSRVARVIVEADYRMKLIGIDKLEAGPSIPSYFDLLPTASQKNPPAMEALRWWLTMKYDAVAHSPDRKVFEFQGSAVLCQSENQMLTSEGKHLPTGKSEGINREFAAKFTNHYADLAQQDQVFADVQNVFDLALVAALVRQEAVAKRSTWDLGAFAPAGQYRAARHVVPKEVDSVVNHRVYNGRDIVVQVAGGVRGDLMAVAQDPKLARESQELTEVATTAAAPQLPAGRWWWDAAK